MDEFVKPTRNHGGLRGKPAPDVGIGIRVRGKDRRLTGYVSIKLPVLLRLMRQEHIEDGAYFLLTIANKNGKRLLRLVPAAPKGFVSELPKANARLRLAKSGEYLLETTMIPIVAGDVLTRRVATEFVLKDHESLTLSFFDWPVVAQPSQPEKPPVEVRTQPDHKSQADIPPWAEEPEAEL